MNKEEFGKKSDTLLRKLHNKEITMKQFVRECAYWMLQKECFEDFVPISHIDAERIICSDKSKTEEENSHEYRLFSNIEAMTKENKEKFFKDNSDWLIKHSFVKLYYTIKAEVNHQNKRRLEQAQEFYEHIDSTDNTALSIYERRIKEFKESCYIIQPDIVNETVQEFGGKIC